MGYRVKKRTFKLVFQEYEDELFNGLEVIARSVSINSYLQISEMFTGSTRNREKYRAALEAFLPVLVSWNAEDEDGNPLPLTVDTLADQEEYFMVEIVTAWMRGVASIPDPLVSRSSDGEPSPEESIPMEPLFDDPRSLLTQN